MTTTARQLAVAAGGSERSRRAASPLSATRRRTTGANSVRHWRSNNSPRSAFSLGGSMTRSCSWLKARSAARPDDMPSWIEGTEMCTLGTFSVDGPTTETAPPVVLRPRARWDLRAPWPTQGHPGGCRTGRRGSWGGRRRRCRCTTFGQYARRPITGMRTGACRFSSQGDAASEPGFARVPHHGPLWDPVVTASRANSVTTSLIFTP